MTAFLDGKVIAEQPGSGFRSGLDAVMLATASDANVEKLASEMESRSIAIPGSGRNQRKGNNSYALMIFGRSTRESN